MGFRGVSKRQSYQGQWDASECQNNALNEASTQKMTGKRNKQIYTLFGDS